MSSEIEKLVERFDRLLGPMQENVERATKRGDHRAIAAGLRTFASALCSLASALEKAHERQTMTARFQRYMSERAKS